MKVRYLRHRPATFAVFCLIGAISPSVMRAGIDIGMTPFSGIETDFTTLGNQNLPYTDAFSRVVSGGIGNNIQSGSGVFTFAGDTLTFSNLAPGTHAIGFGLNQSTDFFIQSVTLSNGDSVTVGTSFLNPFLSFSDSTAFTSASVVFGGADFGFGSGYLADFRTSDVISAVPEPASLLLLATVAAILMIGVWRRFRNTAISEDGGAR